MYAENYMYKTQSTRGRTMRMLNMSWNRFDTAARNLAGRIRHSEIPISAIYGNPRGGLCLAVRLSHLLNIPLIVQLPEVTHDSPRDILWVDDIVDTGNSGDVARTHYRVASLYWNPKAPWRPDFYIYKKPENSWVVFPWERKLFTIK